MSEVLHAQTPLEALQAICVMPWGFCCCPAQMGDMEGKPDADHCGECRDARAVIAKAKEAPTRETIRNADADGFNECVYDSVCSVELGETAKGDVQVKSVKVYAKNVEEAGRTALAEFRRLKLDMNRTVVVAMDGTTTPIESC